MKLVGLDEWEDSDGFFSGPPCQDFSGLGQRAGVNGFRGSLLFDTLRVIKHLSERPGRPLKWIILENVKALCHNTRAGNVLHDVKEWWAEHMAGWTSLAVWVLNARDFGLAQQRDRVFLIAFSRDVVDAVGFPEPPAKLPPVHLKEFLAEPGELSLDGSSGLTVQQRVNLHEYSALYDKVSQESEFAVVDVGRSLDKSNFNNRLHLDYCPTLTCSNVYLHVLSKQKATNNHAPQNEPTSNPTSFRWSENCFRL
jgi:site-specific DNA-cytosine methylase